MPAISSAELDWTKGSMSNRLGSHATPDDRLCGRDPPFACGNEGAAKAAPSF